MKDKKQRSVDPAALEMMQKADECAIGTAFSRHELQQPRCGFGELGVCCRICDMGPCRINPFGEEPTRGVCGANAATIAARHLIRQVAAGASAHSDHGRDIVHTLLFTATGEAQGFSIKNPERLKALAKERGLSVE